MASFKIADCPTTLALAKGSQGEHKGTLALNVRNATDRPQAGRVRVESQAGAQPGWFMIEGAAPTSPAEMDLDFGARASRTIKIAVAVPPSTPGDDHVFRVWVTSERDPDNDYTQSPAVAFKMPPPEVKPVEPPKTRIPWCTVGAAAAVVVVVGGLFFWMFSGPKLVVVSTINNQRFVEAATSLAQAGFVVGQSRIERRTDLADQVVISSKPQQGASAPAGSKVVLVVNDNPPGGGRGVFACKRNPALCARIDNFAVLQNFARENPTILQGISPGVRERLAVPQ